MLVLKNLNNHIPVTETKAWSMKDPGCWEKYKTHSVKAGETIGEKIDMIGDDVERIEKMIEKENEAMYWKSFKRGNKI